MVLADGIGRADGVVRKLIVFRYLADKICGSLPVGQLLAEEGVEHRAGGVQRLELVLNIKCAEDIIGVADGQVAGVGVIRSAAVFGSGDDVGVLLDIVLCKAVRGALCGGGFKVIQVTVLLLIIRQALTHVVENILGKLLALLGGHVGPYPVGVKACLVHADKADGGEVVIEGAEIVLRVGVQPLVEKLGDDGALYLQGACRDVHELVKTLVEIGLVRCKVCDAGHVYRDNADRAGALARAEVAAGLFAQLTQVKAQAAAHGADIAGLHIGVDVVGEVRSAVLCGHLEQHSVVLGGRPVKVTGDGIGRDRVLEAAAVCVALDHDIDERLVDHVHLGLAVAVGEVHLLAADDSGHILEVGGNRPVKGDVGKRSLSAPAGRSVHAENKRLDALLDLLVGQVIDLDKRSKVGVKRRERLCACPLVLHDAEEVHHLVAEGGKVACRGGIDLARNAETLLNKLL